MRLFRIASLGYRQHPELAAGASLALAYDARTFAVDAGPAAAYAPRLVNLPVPASLP
jgi:hypothetical protein